MAIRIIEGVPGSGKTYYAVKHLADRYFEKQEDGRYELIQPITIITNIDSFQPEHLSLKDCINDAGGIKAFFEEHYQKELTERIGNQIVYIIDEAQKWFRKGARDLDSVFSYFEYHRHFGHDIYLITQNAKKLPYDISCLTEYLIVAAPRTRSVIGEFKYKWMSDGELLKREGFKPDAGIFALYKSMDQKESEKIKNPVIRTAISVIALAVCIMLGCAYYFKVQWMGGGSASPTTHSSAAPSTTAKNSPSSGTAVSLPGPTGNPVTDFNLVRISSITDHTGVYYLYLGALIRSDFFPHKLYKAKTGTYVLVSNAEAAKIRSYQDSIPDRPPETNKETQASGPPEHASELGAAAHGGPLVVSATDPRK